jgi:hypothetical protein
VLDAVVVLAAAVAAFAYNFTVGEVRPSEDGRVAGQLGDAMGNCVARHATYRFVEEPSS